MVIFFCNRLLIGLIVMTNDKCQLFLETRPRGVAHLSTFLEHFPYVANDAGNGLNNNVHKANYIT